MREIRTCAYRTSRVFLLTLASHQLSGCISNFTDYMKERVHFLQM